MESLKLGCKRAGLDSKKSSIKATIRSWLRSWISARNAALSKSAKTCVTTNSSSKVQALRRRLNRNRCVVCGNPPQGIQVMFTIKAAEQIYAPFCKEHLDKASEYANPVFENPVAVELFRQMFPVTYLQDVKGKPILFFGRHITSNSNKQCRGGREWLSLHRNLLQTYLALKSVLILVSWSLPKAPPAPAP